MPTSTHRYLAASDPSSPSTPKRDELNLKPMNAELSAALEKMIKLAHKLANHPSILNAIAIILRYSWSNDKANMPIPLDAVATEAELKIGHQIVNGQWPAIYADETNPDKYGWHSRTANLRHKIFINLQNVQDLATALAPSRPNPFQVAGHTLLGAIIIIHEACTHAFRTKHFISPTEAQSPPAYRSINDRTPLEDQILWKDGVTGGGESGSWAEDSGVGGILGCVVNKAKPHVIKKVVCERALAGRQRTVSLADKHVIDIVENPASTEWLPIGKDYESDGSVPRGKGFAMRLRTQGEAVSWRKDRFNADEVPPLPGLG
ncbi:hypothetical protein PILCRDRAFT_275520 [Piloderma croceum F 1598]|uniref:Uncharacterized protein n=1 Tax=Piloderma croceum (strain F 1598) TaxID=765440 RepID=A0A0C3FT59_PILCF|nr:hypothetical protein PILCRDRAFT_275520 [Piloderma croceum F 1598]